MAFLDEGFTSLTIKLLLAVVVWYASVAFYRLYLHPLARVPGPKLAALSTLYEFYWDVYLPAKYSFQVDDLHKIYGPIVRIGPNEVHIDDPEFFNTLYSQSATYDKDEWFYRFMVAKYSGFSTPDHNLHRLRRSKENPFFSKNMVNQLEPVLVRYVKVLQDAIKDKAARGDAIDLTSAYKSYGADVVTEYAFLESYGLLSSPDFSKSFHNAQNGFGKMVPAMRHIWFLGPMFKGLPEFVVKSMSPEAAGVLLVNNHIKDQVGKIMKETNAVDKAHPTVVREILNSDLPEEEKSFASIEEKASIIIMAGYLTVARVLEVASFQLCQRDDIRDKLRKELATVTPVNGVVPLRELEPLPYLTAFLHEALRTAHAVTGRLPRINRKSSVIYKEYVLPKDTVISMSMRNMHEHPDIYPEPKKFDPERWTDPEERRRLQKYFAPFGKGTRHCLGINLAWAELYLLAGNLFKQFDLELFETTEDDIAYKHDVFGPLADDGAKGVWVKVVN